MKALSAIKLTWKDEPAPTAALNISATVSRTSSSIFAIRPAPNFSPSCGPPRIIFSAMPCSVLTETVGASSPSTLVWRQVFVKCADKSNSPVRSASSSTKGGE